MVQYTTKKMNTGTFNTYYCEAGEAHKETIIFLHGAGLGTNSESNWSAILPILGEKFHVLALDFVGYGKTDVPENTNLSYWEWTTARIKQIVELMDFNKIEKAHLVGNSMGGLIALNALTYAPERFDKVVTMGSAGGEMKELSPELLRASNFYKNPTKENLRNILVSFMYDETIIQTLLDSLDQRYALAMDEKIREMYPKLFAPSPNEYTIPPSYLMRIKNEVLLIHGYEDRVVPKESSLFLVEYIPNAQLVLLKKCGHWAQIEQKDRFVQLVEQFFDAANAK